MNKRILQTAVFSLLAMLMATPTVAQNRSTLRPATGIDSAMCYFDSLGAAHLRVELDDPKVKEQIEIAAQQLVADFNEHMGKLWHQWTPIEIKEYTVQERGRMKDSLESLVLDCFIARADTFSTEMESKYKVEGGKYRDSKGILHDAKRPYYDEETKDLREAVVEKVLHEAARIEISSRNRKTTTQRYIRQYLNNVKNMTAYKQVEFSAGGFTVQGTPKRMADGRYAGTICYHQYFTGYRRDGGAYRDDTYRCVTYYVTVVVKNTSMGDMIYWNIKLGDIRAVETK